MLASRFANGSRSTSLKQDGGEVVVNDEDAGWSDESDMEEGGDRGGDAEKKEADSERVVVVCSELSKDDRLDGFWSTMGITPGRAVLVAGSWLVMRN